MRRMWILLLLLFCLPALAEELETLTDGEWEYTVGEDGTATLVDWHLAMLDEIPAVVEVPATLGGHPLRHLGDNVFNTSMTLVETPFQLVLPEGVVDCEGDPFLCLHDAEEIVFPSTFIGDLEGCFHHVDAEITVAQGNPAFEVRDGFLVDTRTDKLVYTAFSVGNAPLTAVKRIGPSALINWGWNCYPDWDEWPEPGQGLTLTIPEGVEHIGAYAVYDNVLLSKLILPDSLTSMDPFAFTCTSLTEIQFGEELTSIPEACFFDCHDLEAVTLPENISFVGYGAFDDDIAVTTLNPDCHFETLEECTLRIGEEPWWGW